MWVSYAGIDFQKPTDERTTGKRNQKNKKLNNMKPDNNRKQAAQKRSIKYPDHSKQVESIKKWKEFINLKPGTFMTYKSRQYGEKDGHK